MYVILLYFVRMIWLTGLGVESTTIKTLRRSVITWHGIAKLRRAQEVEYAERIQDCTNQVSQISSSSTLLFPPE
jgi:hypothetical protein